MTLSTATVRASIAGLLLLFAVSTRLSGQALGPRSISIDSRYLTGAYSTQAYGDFGIELIELATLPASRIEFGGDTGGFGSMIVLAVGSTFFGGAFSLAFHEYGHGTRSAAVGLQPFFGHGTNPTDAAVDKLLDASNPVDTFLEYFFESLFHRGDGYTITSTAHELYPSWSIEDQRAIGWRLNIRAAGINNEMLFTQMIEEHTYRDGGNLGFLPLYFLGKISGWKRRSSTDMVNIMSEYRSLGFDFDGTTVDAASLLTFFLSGTTYQLGKQFSSTIQGAPIYFEPWYWRDIQIPNSQLYLTSSGLSYRVATGYRRGGWRYPFAVERVFQGTNRTEFTVGAERRYDFGDIRLGTTIGRRLELSADVRYRIEDRFALAAGYARYDRRNLHGERFIPTLEHGPTYNDLYVRASLLY